MEQGERSRKGKHLTREERVVVEVMSRGGGRHFTALSIAASFRKSTFISCALTELAKRSPRL